MPSLIRKYMAAFYTRPQAADILAQMAIDDGDETVFDPACGSGTILVSAYRAKHDLYQKRGIAANPHRRFCEREIFGADIMPFAVHLASANLAAMDVPTTITRTQIIPSDSIRLAPDVAYSTSLSHATGQMSLLPTSTPRTRTRHDEEYPVDLGRAGVILMNPPFTKVERGIRRFVDMQKFRDAAGGEVGLWGHFVFLANEFLEDGGVFGAVLPINVLRGRESTHVKQLLFHKWAPVCNARPMARHFLHCFPILQGLPDYAQCAPSSVRHPTETLEPSRNLMPADHHGATTLRAGVPCRPGAIWREVL